MLHYYVHLAWQRCRTQWPATALIALTLAIGIASCMTTLTIVSAFEGDPIPGTSAHIYVVALNTHASAHQNTAGPDSRLQLRDAKALVDARRASAQVALAAATVYVSRADNQTSDRVHGVLAYGQVLQVLGIPLRAGRAWTAQELHSHAPVVIIDATLARHLFGTADAVGRSVRLGTQRFRVVGVTAPWKPRMQFSTVEQASGGPLGLPLQIFIPAGAALAAGVGPAVSGKCDNSAANTMYGSVDVEHCRWLETWVALPTPQAVKRYTNYLNAYTEAQQDAGRFVHPLHAQLYRTRTWMAINGIVPDDVSLDAWLAGAFLVLCMTNVIGLLTARFLQGQSNAAIRRALGATKRQLFAQNLVESALLGLAGGLLAWPLTLLGMWIVHQQPAAYVAAARFSPGVFAGLVMLSLVVGTVVGLWPAWRISCQPPALRIKES